jgi:hypothetical protein
MMGDGARWINTWFEDIRIAEKSLVICWYHLVKKCRDMIGTIGVDVVRRREILGVVLKYLWRGKVDKIIHYLMAQKVANPLSLKGMIEYFINRKAYIPNYHKRDRADLWIATTRVEKLNDWSVSARGKTQGREWTPAGVTAIAVLAVTRRNGELAIWRQATPGSI